MLKQSAPDTYNSYSGRRLINKPFTPAAVLFSFSTVFREWFGLLLFGGVFCVFFFPNLIKMKVIIVIRTKISMQKD